MKKRLLKKVVLANLSKEELLTTIVQLIGDSMNNPPENRKEIFNGVVDFMNKHQTDLIQAIEPEGQHWFDEFKGMFESYQSITYKPNEAAVFMIPALAAKQFFDDRRTGSNEKYWTKANIDREVARRGL